MFKIVTNFKYLRTVVTYENYTDKTINSRLNAVKIQNILSSCLSKHIQIKTYKSTILHVVLIKCKT